MTHGRAELRLIGPASAELLSRLCGLDFHPSAFPNLTARQSSLAKTTQLIIREDIGALPAYSLVGARSLGAYLWLAIMQAGRDLDIGPLGQAALDRVRET
jgi:heterotetrameric sarcosine oxidase gamma subunit